LAVAARRFKVEWQRSNASYRIFDDSIGSGAVFRILPWVIQEQVCCRGNHHLWHHLCHHSCKVVVVDRMSMGIGMGSM